MNALSDPSLEQIHRDELEDKYSKLFLDEGYFSEVASDPVIRQGVRNSPFGEALPKRAAIGAFLSHKLDRDVSPFEQDLARDAYAEAQFGKSKVTDEEFFGLVKGEYEWRNKRREAIKDLQVRVAARTLENAASGKEPAGVAQVFKEWGDAHPDLRDGQNDLPFLAGALRAQQRLSADMQGIEAPAARILSGLKASIEGKEDDIPALAREIAALPREKREKAYGYVALAAQAGQIDPGGIQQFAENFGKSFLRGFDFLGAGGLAAQEGNARLWLNAFESGRFHVRDNDDGTVTPIQGDFFGREGTREATPEEREKFLNDTRAIMPSFQVARELKNLGQTAVDPIKMLSDEGIMRDIEAGAYGFAGSLPLMGATAVNPLVGAMAYADYEYDRIRLENPEMDMDAARTLATFEGFANAAIDRLQLRTLTGRLPVLGRFLEGIKSNGIRRTLKVAGNIVEQNIQEGAQDLIAPLTEAIVASVREDMEAKDLPAMLAEYADSRAEVFFSVLPLALIGAGAATMRDIRNPSRERFEADLRRAGFSERQREFIMSSESETVAEGRIALEWKNRAPEDIEAGKREIIESMPATSENISTDGQKFRVTDSAGNVILETPDPDAAALAAAESKRTSELEDLAQVRAMIAFYDQDNAEQGRADGTQTFTVTGEKKTLADVAPVEDINKLAERMQMEGIAAGTDLRTVSILGENIGELRNGIYTDTIKLHEGANALTVVHERLDGETKRALAEGRRSRDWFLRNLRDYETATGESVVVTDADGRVSDQAIIEGVTKLGEAYFAGRVRDDRLPTGIRGFFREMIAYFRDVFARAGRLRKAIAEGKVKGDFAEYLADSVGLPMESRVERAHREYMAEMEAEARDVMRSSGQGMELLKAIRAAGGLPSEKSPFAANWKGELSNVKENLKAQGKGVAKGNKGLLVSDLFRVDAPDPDRLLELLNEQGFDFFTPDDLFSALDERFRTGREMFGYKTEKAMGFDRSFSVRQEGAMPEENRAASQSAGQPSPGGLTAEDARYLELAKNPEANRDELQRMVDEAANAAGFTLKVYHGGTVDKSFDTLNGERSTKHMTSALGSFFSETEQIAKQYGKTRSYFIEDTNLLDISFNEASQIETLEKAREYRNFADANGYDGFILDAGKNLDPDMGMLIDREFVIFNSSKIKSADPVTYDDAGNVIPLSRRFDSGNDIRGSVNPESPAPEGGAESFSIVPSSKAYGMQAALERLRGNPEQRLAIYERARARLDKTLAQNAKTIEAMRSEGAKKFELDRARLVNMIGEFEAVLSVLPPEVRGRVGGFKKLAEFKTEAARLRYFADRVERIDEALEGTLRAEYADRIKAILEKARPKAGDAGVRRSTLGPEAQGIATAALRASLLDEDGAAERMGQIEAALNAGDIAPEAESRLTSEWSILNMFGDLENRSASDLADAYKWIQKTIRDGRAQWRIREDARIAEQREKQGMILAGLKEATRGGLKAKQNLQGKLDALKQFVLSHQSFSGLLKIILPDTAGKLVDEWSDKMRKADNAVQDAEIAAQEKVLEVVRGAAKAKGLMGTANAVHELKKIHKGKVTAITGRKVKSERIGIELAGKIVRGEADRGALTEEDIRTLRDELASLPRDSRKEYVTIQRVIFRGEEEALDMSKADAIQLLLSWEQPDVQAKMRREGWTDESVAQMRELTDDPVSQALFDYLRDYYRKQRDVVNPVYARMFGMNMPFVKNYAPTRFQNSEDSVDIGPDGTPISSGGTTPGFAKSRVSHSAPIRIMDALTVYQQHVVQQAHWVHFAEFAREFRGVMKNRDVRSAMEQEHGATALQLLDRWLDQLEKRGGNKSMELFAVSKFLSALVSAKAVSSLGFNPRTIAMQLDSMVRFIFAMPAKDIMAALSDIKGVMDSVPKAWASDTVQRRLQGGASPEVRYLYEQSAMRPSFWAKAAQISMLPMQYVDAGLTSVSSAIVYRDAYNRAISDGAPTKQAEAIAADAMDDAVYRYSQPVGFGSKSLKENSGNAVTKMFMLFLSDPRLKTAILVDAAEGLATGRGDKGEHIRRIFGVFAMAMLSQTIANIYRDGMTGDDDEEIWTVEGYLKAAALAPFSGFFLVGAVAEGAISKILGESFFSPSRDPLQDALSRGIRASNNLSDTLNFDDPNAMFKQWENIARTFAVAGPASGAPAAALNIIKPLLGLKENVEKED